MKFLERTPHAFLTGVFLDSTPTTATQSKTQGHRLTHTLTHKYTQPYSHRELHPTQTHTYRETDSFTHTHSHTLRFRLAAAKIGDIRSLVLWIKNKQMMIYFRIRTDCVLAGNVSIWYDVRGLSRMIDGYVGGGLTRLEIFSTKTVCEDQWRVVSAPCYSGPQ